MRFFNVIFFYGDTYFARFVDARFERRVFFVARGGGFVRELISFFGISFRVLVEVNDFEERRFWIRLFSF